MFFLCSLDCRIFDETAFVDSTAIGGRLQLLTDEAVGEGLALQGYYQAEGDCDADKGHGVGAMVAMGEREYPCNFYSSRI